MAVQQPSGRSRGYRAFARIDGRHPFKQSVPGAYVDYRARRRHDGRVAYFNFDLAREMGLLPAAHPDELTAQLAEAIRRTFGIVIINEHDFLSGLQVPEADLLPHPYMATRYLQLQHPDKQGKSSGDGRSVWNGSLTHRGVTWDLSSCGTGVTRLCPATAEHGAFFPTGNWLASYGCGTAAIAEGLGSALMSEVFHRNGIATERVLAVIALPSGLAINVRAARNLLRPSHFLLHLRRNDLASLRRCVDYFAERQIANGDWPKLPPGRRRHRFLAESMARTFARITAAFESEYIFCWLDWDGDNILADGGIIDYGCVRQFGLYHREYRFADTDRMSTTIPEQRRKGRLIVQKFAQIRDFLSEGKRRPLRELASDPVLALFDQVFQEEKQRRLLHKVGLEPALAERMREKNPELVAALESIHGWFERAKSARGPEPVPDGLSWNAIYCTRDLLRELPWRLLEGGEALPAAELMEIALSSYAQGEDRTLTPHRARQARAFRRAYVALLEAAARGDGVHFEDLLERVAERSARINRAARITGDSVDYATSRLLRQRGRLSVEELHHVVQAFARDQDLNPAAGSRAPDAPRPKSEAPPRLQRIRAGLSKLVDEYREGL